MIHNIYITYNVCCFILIILVASLHQKMNPLTLKIGAQLSCDDRLKIQDTLGEYDKLRIFTPTLSFMMYSGENDMPAFMFVKGNLIRNIERLIQENFYVFNLSDEVRAFRAKPRYSNILFSVKLPDSRTLKCYRGSILHFEGARYIEYAKIERDKLLEYESKAIEDNFPYLLGLHDSDHESYELSNFNRLRYLYFDECDFSALENVKNVVDVETYRLYTSKRDGEWLGKRKVRISHTLKRIRIHINLGTDDVVEGDLVDGDSRVSYSIKSYLDVFDHMKDSQVVVVFQLLNIHLCNRCGIADGDHYHKLNQVLDESCSQLYTNGINNPLRRTPPDVRKRSTAWIPELLEELRSRMVVQDEFLEEVQ